MSPQPDSFHDRLLHQFKTDRALFLFCQHVERNAAQEGQDAIALSVVRELRRALIDWLTVRGAANVLLDPTK